MRRRDNDAWCLYLFVRFGIFRQQLGRKYLSHPRSWPEQASQVTLLPVQVVEMALTNTGSHGTSAEPKQSRLPAIEKKQTRSGLGRTLGKSTVTTRASETIPTASSLPNTRAVQVQASGEQLYQGQHRTWDTEALLAHPPPPVYTLTWTLLNTVLDNYFV